MAIITATERQRVRQPDPVRRHVHQPLHPHVRQPDLLRRRDHQPLHPRVRQPDLLRRRVNLVQMFLLSKNPLQRGHLAPEVAEAEVIVVAELPGVTGVIVEAEPPGVGGL